MGIGDFVSDFLGGAASKSADAAGEAAYGDRDAQQRAAEDAERRKEEAARRAEEERLGEIKSSREKTLRDLQVQEAQAKGILLQRTSESGRAIDEQLSKLLEESGFGFGQVRRQIGGQQGTTGLLRSGFTGQRLADSRSAQFETESGLRSSAETQKRGAERAAIQAQRGVADRRIEIQNRLTDLEIQGLSSARFIEESAKMKQDFNTFVTDLQVSSQDKQLLGSIIGGALGLGALAASSKADPAPEEE